jgi:imidazolonepropionase-like amidohydrolase
VSEIRRAPCRAALAALGIVSTILACLAPPTLLLAEPQAAPAAKGSAVAAPFAGSIVLRCGRLIDGLSPRVRRDVAVVVRDGRIASVGRLPRDARELRVLDLREHTCLPGLIDLHTHLTERPQDTADLRVYFTRTDEEQRAISRASAAATLAAGFTSVRNVGAYIEGADLALRDAIARGELPGPRMQVSGPYLTIPGGGGDLLIPGVPEREIPARVRAGVARGPEQFRARAERNLSRGADLLKVIASGAVLAYGGVPGAPEMTPAELHAVVAVARARGRRVAAHAHGAESVRDAILAGADTIEHASLIDDAGIRLARERGVALAMDVYNGDWIDGEGRRAGWPDEFLRKNLETTEAQRQAFTRAVRAGVTIVYATDAGVFPHGQNARQFRIMVERGMTPMQAIQSATSAAARAMGWEDRAGAIAVGRFGDVIAVRGDPLRDVTLLERVAVIVQGGVVR